MKQVICEKNKLNITHRSGRIGQLRSNSVGLSFIIFGECVSSSEGSDPQITFQYIDNRRFHTLQMVCGAPDFKKTTSQTQTAWFYLECFAFRHPLQPGVRCVMQS